MGDFKREHGEAKRLRRTADHITEHAPVSVEGKLRTAADCIDTLHNVNLALREQAADLQAQIAALTAAQPAGEEVCGAPRDGLSCYPDCDCDTEEDCEYGTRTTPPSPPTGEGRCNAPRDGRTCYPECVCDTEADCDYPPPASAADGRFAWMEDMSDTDWQALFAHAPDLRARLSAALAKPRAGAVATVCLRGDRYASGHMIEVQLQIEPGTELPIGTKLYLHAVPQLGAAPEAQAFAIYDAMSNVMARHRGASDCGARLVAALATILERRP